MRVEHESEKKVKKAIKKIISEEVDLKLYKVFLFGSRVNNKSNERSDIDVGIMGDQEVPSNHLENIKEKIEELPFLYKIDVVDFKKVSDDFKKVALQKIEKL